MLPGHTDSNKREKDGRPHRKARNKDEAPKIWVYETDSQRSRTVRQTPPAPPGTFGTFEKGRNSTKFQPGVDGAPYFKLEVPAGKRHMDIVMPEDKVSGLGPSQIASVSVPWSVFVKTSVFKNPAFLYVTPRC